MIIGMDPKVFSVWKQNRDSEMKKSDELKRQAADLVDDADKLLAKVQSEKRELTASEAADFDYKLAKSKLLETDAAAEKGIEDKLSQVRAARPSSHEYGGRVPTDPRRSAPTLGA